jgi:ABC-type Na+ transport system ATPase subunit NatA
MTTLEDVFLALATSNLPTADAGQATEHEHGGHSNLDGTVGGVVETAAVATTTPLPPRAPPAPVTGDAEAHAQEDAVERVHPTLPPAAAVVEVGAGCVGRHWQLSGLVSEAGRALNGKTGRCVAYSGTVGQEDMRLHIQIRGEDIIKFRTCYVQEVAAPPPTAYDTITRGLRSIFARLDLDAESAAGLPTKHKVAAAGRPPPFPKEEAPPAFLHEPTVVEVCNHMLVQYRVLLWKRFVIMRRDWKSFLFQVLAPLAIVVLCFLIYIIGINIEGPSKRLDSNLYGPTQVVFSEFNRDTVADTTEFVRNDDTVRTWPFVVYGDDAGAGAGSLAGAGGGRRRAQQNGGGVPGVPATEAQEAAAAQIEDLQAQVNTAQTLLNTISIIQRITGEDTYIDSDLLSRLQTSLDEVDAALELGDEAAQAETVADLLDVIGDIPSETGLGNLLNLSEEDIANFNGSLDRFPSEQYTLDGLLNLDVDEFARLQAYLTETTSIDGDVFNVFSLLTVASVWSGVRNFASVNDGFAVDPRDRVNHTQLAESMGRQDSMTVVPAATIAAASPTASALDLDFSSSLALSYLLLDTYDQHEDHGDPTSRIAAATFYDELRVIVHMDGVADRLNLTGVLNAVLAPLRVGGGGSGLNATGVSGLQNVTLGSTARERNVYLAGTPFLSTWEEGLKDNVRPFPDDAADTTYAVGEPLSFTSGNGNGEVYTEASSYTVKLDRAVEDPPLNYTLMEVCLRDLDISALQQSVNLIAAELACLNVTGGTIKLYNSTTLEGDENLNGGDVAGSVVVSDVEDFDETYQFDVTLIHNTTAIHAIPAYVAEFTKAQFKALVGNDAAEYTVRNHPMPLTAFEDFEIQVLVSFFSLIFFLFPLGFTPSGYAGFVVSERTLKAKHLQLVSGANVVVYWLATFTFDLIQYFLVVGGSFLVWYLVDYQPFVGTVNASLACFMLLALHGLAVIPQCYCLSFLFSTASSTQIGITLWNFVTGFIFVLAYNLLSQLEMTAAAAELLATYLFRLFPAYNCGEGLINLTFAYFQASILGTKVNLFAWEVTLRSAYCMAIQALVFFALVIAIEYNQLWITHFELAKGRVHSIALWHRSRFSGTAWASFGRSDSRSNGAGGDGDKDSLAIEMATLAPRGDSHTANPVLARTGSVNTAAEQPQHPFGGPSGGRRRSLNGRSGNRASPDDEDADVTAERVRVRHTLAQRATQGGALSSHTLSANGNVLEVEGLRKVFPARGKNPAKVAVHDLTLGIQKGECFGFLGVNGAGKTTTISMLTGDLLATSGSAFICGLDIHRHPMKVRKHIGYCPQFDPLLSLMTARESLHMYGKLKGLKDPCLRQETEDIIVKVGLSKWADNVAGSYSGGNKRKLSLGLALIGSPECVFLDEPSAGMDPIARRQMWDILSDEKDKAGRSIILTTHLMEVNPTIVTTITTTTLPYRRHGHTTIVTTPTTPTNITTNPTRRAKPCATASGSWFWARCSASAVCSTSSPSLATGTGTSLRADCFVLEYPYGLNILCCNILTD